MKLITLTCGGIDWDSEYSMQIAFLMQLPCIVGNIALRHAPIAYIRKILKPVLKLFRHESNYKMGLDM